MAKKYLGFIILLLLIRQTFGFEENYKFKFLQNNEIQDINIIDIKQDTLGFIWISSAGEGLIKFDGIKVTKYFKNKKLRKIKITKNNEIYISSQTSLYKYDSNIDSLKTVIKLKNSDNIRSYSVTDKNNIFIAKKDTVFAVDFVSNSSKPIITTGNQINEIEACGDEIWFATKKGLAMYKPSIGLNYLTDSVNVKKVELFETNSDSIVFVYKNTLAFYNNKNKVVTKFSYPDTNMIISDFQIVNNKILFSSNIGVFYFDVHIKNFEKIYYSEKGLKQYLLNIFIDKSESIWIGTKNGIIKSFPKDKLIYYDINNYLENDIFSSNYIFNMKIDEDDNLYYITSEKYLIKKNINDVFTIFYPFKDVKERIRIRNIFIYSKNIILITTSKKIYSFNLDKKELKEFADQRAFDLDVFDDDNILISNMYSLVNINSKGKIKHKIDIANVTAMNKISDDSYLILSKQSGLMIYNIKQNQITKKFTGLIENEFIPAMFFDQQDSLLYLRAKQRLKIVNIKNGETKYYTKEDGLLSNIILGFVKYDGLVYINTSSGLSIFDKTQLLSSIGKLYGFKCFDNTEANKFWKYNYINNNLLVKDSKNRFFVGGRNGLNSITPIKLYQHTKQQPLLLTSIKIFGEEYFQKAINQNESSYIFSYKNNIISFEFASTNYQDIEKNSYSFFLENYNKKWEYPKENFISYRSLDPGEYKLKTRYADYTGKWWDGPIYSIIITPPIWQTPIFYILLIISLSIIVFAFIKLQTYRIKSQNKALEYRVVRRTQELQKKKDELVDININLEDLVKNRTEKLSIANEKLIDEFRKKELLLNQLQASRETIELNLKQQTLLSNISMEFISLQNFKEKITKILKMLGTELELDSVFLFEDKHVDEEKSELIRWFRKEDKLEFSKINYEYFKDWISVMHSNEMILCNDIESLGSEYNEILKDSNIHSLLILPIIVNEDFYGFLGSVFFDNNKFWDDSTITLFKTFAHIISNAFERKIFQMELLDKEKTSKALLNASDSFAILFDIEGKIKLTNKNFLNVINKELEEIIGTSVFEYFDKESIPKRQEYFDECLKTKKTIHYEDELNGQIYSNNISPILDVRGKVIRVAHFTHNITKQKEAERILKQHQEELKKEVDQRTKELRFINSELLREIKNREKAEKELINSEKLKRENLKKLALQLAHEIKNPLSSINSSAQLVETIQTMKPDVESTIKHMKRITTNVDTCNRVIKELYQFTHDAKLQIQNISVATLCNELKEYGENITNQKNIKLECVNNAPNLYISIDKFRIMQALKNIVANSCDAIENVGKIELFCKKVNNNLKMEIIDNGSGMMKDTLEKIFEPFYTSKSKGFGLGLAIVEKIIERHSGTIKVESKIGEGTKMIIELPVSQVLSGEVNE